MFFLSFSVSFCTFCVLQMILSFPVSMRPVDLASSGTPRYWSAHVPAVKLKLTQPNWGDLEASRASLHAAEQRTPKSICSVTEGDGRAPDLLIAAEVVSPPPPLPAQQRLHNIYISLFIRNGPGCLSELRVSVSGFIVPSFSVRRLAGWKRLFESGHFSPSCSLKWFSLSSPLPLQPQQSPRLRFA